MAGEIFNWVTATWSVASTEVIWTRFVFQRLLAFIYFVAFAIAYRQFVPLCGRNGLLPIRLFIKDIRIQDAPSLFYFFRGDRVLRVAAGIGCIVSLLALSGLTDLAATWVSVASWFVLWFLYLSFVNVGQTFYGFGWETLLLETGFLAIFLGPLTSPGALAVIWLLRWVLFRLMLGAGLIKIRGDACWRDLTCMEYHYETQPAPNPLSPYFHRLPPWMSKVEVLFNHVVELVVPFLFLAPQPLAAIGALITIGFQLTLILSGNLSWLNCLSVVLCFSCFDDAQYRLLSAGFAPVAAVALGIPWWIHLTLVTLVGILSWRPIRNLISPNQAMNASFEPLHLVNTYGAFGSVTRERLELVIEGTQSEAIDEITTWQAYEFPMKPGDPARRPPQVTPYHHKLDWQMWFAAMVPYHHSPWLLNLIGKILQGNDSVLSLFRWRPFVTPPTFVRVLRYRYRFSRAGEKGYWQRDLREVFLPPLSLQDDDFHQVLEAHDWLDRTEGST